MVHLRLLGSVDLQDEQGRRIGAILTRPKRLALLAYLAAADPPSFHRRDTLLGIFWPELDEIRARDALNQALRFLRKSLGPDIVVSRGNEEVGLESGQLWCDITAFRAAVDEGRSADALELYRGDLLQGFFLGDARAFEEWVERDRSVLREHAASAARALAEEAEGAAKYTLAVRWGRRAVALASDDERALRRLLTLLARAGDRAGALQAYDDFARRLRAEYEAEPAPETQSLADAIRRNLDASAAVSAGSLLPAGRAAYSPQAGPGRVAPSASPQQGGPPSQSSRTADSLGSTTLDGRYVIERELGRGGMATVYLVDDLRAKRRVALKVLNPDIISDRFLREIRIAARLDHPNILSLFDSGHTDGLLYFTMPYVEGESLRNYLRQERQLPLHDALDITRQVASALDYAHGHGVVHRDIKPENILLRGHAQRGDASPGGGRHALVTDFGIAGAISTAGDVSMEMLTRVGTLLGTPHYMSPEQATGERRIDGRSDVYSLGCVLYEMLIGEPPYTGVTTQAVFARHALAPVPSLRTVRPDIPPAVDRAVRTALAKAPADRFRTAGDFVAALARPDERASTSGWKRTTIRIAVSTAAAALGLVVFTVGRSLVKPAALATPDRRQLTYVGDAILATVSPDGQFIAYLVPTETAHYVIVQDMAGGTPDTVATITQLIGAWSLEWSPDGTRLLWGTAKGEVAIVPRLGGAPRRITAGKQFDGGVFANWLPDGAHVSLHPDYVKRILVVDLESADTLWIPVAGRYDFMFDGSWSPDGRLFAVVTLLEDPLRSAIRIVSRDGRTAVVAEDSVYLGSPHWSAKGDAVYFAHGSDAIWKVDVSPRTGDRRGSARAVHTQLEALRDLAGHVKFSLTPDGRRMVYARGAVYSNIWIVDSTGVAPRPRTTPLTTGTAMRWSPVVSPDGRWIAFAQETNGAAEIFRMPTEGGPASQLTFGARVWWRSWIAWSPDGDRLAFTSVRDGHARVWVAPVSGGTPRQLERTRITTGVTHLAWSPGSLIAYQTPELNNLNVVDPSSGVVRFIGDTTFCCYFFPHYSPDGRRLTVFRQRGANHGVWVYQFQDSSWRQVSDSMLFPRGWSADGRYVYAQLAWKQPLFRVDVRERRKPEHVLTAPFREVECAPAGPFRPGAFVCVAFDFVSDVWMIDHFDSAGH